MSGGQPGRASRGGQRARAGLAARTSHALAAAALLTPTLGCASRAKSAEVARPAGDRGADSRPLMDAPPYGGASRDDAVVRIVGPVACSGTLVAEDLVVTAHHCVSARDERGRATGVDVAPTSLSIELGGGDLPWAEVGVRAIVSPDCGYELGHGDIALLVLERRLVGMSTATPRLEQAPSLGEGIDAAGFGRCTMSRGGVVRERRTSGPITSVDDGSFSAEAAVCPGDSGGPVREKRGQDYGDLVGVVSSSVMDGDPETPGRSYFTRLDRWRHLFAAAREIADGASAAELPPFRSCVGR